MAFNKIVNTTNLFMEERIMKNIFGLAIATVAFAACSTNPTYTNQPMDHRNPAGLGGSLDTSSAASAKLAGEVVNVTVNSSRVSADGSSRVAAGLWDFSKDVAGASYDASKEVVVLGWTASQNVSAFVVTSAKESARITSQVADSIVTASGDVIQASANSSRSAVGVSVKVVEGSSEAVVYIGKQLLGSVRVSAAKASELAQSAAEGSSAAARWSVNEAGELLHASGEVIGNVVDSSGRAVRFLVDGSGKLLMVSKDAAVAVFNGSSEASASLARNIGKGLKASGKAVSATVTFSAQKTLAVIRWSAKGVAHSSTVVSNSIKNLFMSAPEDRNIETGTASAGGSTVVK